MVLPSLRDAKRGDPAAHGASRSTFVVLPSLRVGEGRAERLPRHGRSTFVVLPSLRGGHHAARESDERRRSTFVVLPSLRDEQVGSAGLEVAASQHLRGAAFIEGGGRVTSLELV